MTFVGLDLHKRYITACALGAGGALVAEVRQLATSIEAVSDWLAVLPAPVTVAMEATLYWERALTLHSIERFEDGLVQLHYGVQNHS